MVRLLRLKFSGILASVKRLGWLSFLSRTHLHIAATDYHSSANVDFYCIADIEPLIASSREHHHPAPMARFTEQPPLPDGAIRVEKVAHRLKTLAGKKLYALRKQTVEPVFRIVKSVLVFR